MPAGSPILASSVPTACHAAHQRCTWSASTGSSGSGVPGLEVTVYPAGQPGQPTGVTATTIAGGQFDFEQPFVWVDPGEDAIVNEQYDYLVDLLDEFGIALAGFTSIVIVFSRRDGQLHPADRFRDAHPSGRSPCARARLYRRGH